MKKLFYLLITCWMFASCVEEYKIPESKSASNNADLVIQGRILSGDKSVIYITGTQPLNSDEEPESVLNAEVTIIGQNGYESELAEFDIEQDCYTIDTSILPQNTLYALQVKVGNETYQSEFQPILTSPEIADVTYQERNDGISIHVSTHNDNDASKHYMWSYEEDWEFHAPTNIVDLSGIPVFKKTFYADLDPANGVNPYLYCWSHSESSNIHIYSTTELNTNSVKDVELFRIPVDDIRISYIYSILVKQSSISEQAFNYYRSLEKLTEESNGLFTPMPSEVKGNVTCTSNPGKKVHGYVLASTITSKRIFIYEEQFGQIHSEYDYECIQETIDPTIVNWYYRWSELVDKGGAIVLTKQGKYYPGSPDYLSSVLYTRNCVDCRTVEGATKKRPDFWPNNHE